MVGYVDGNESITKLGGTAGPSAAPGASVRHMELLLRAETS